MEANTDQYSPNALMDEAVCSLSNVSSNLKGLLEDLAYPPLRCNLDQDLQRLDESLKQLTTNIGYLAGPFFNQKKKDMASSLEELEAIRTKYKNLQREWDNQQEHLGRLQGDMFKMRSQLKNQSSFCACLGAIMGSLMWKFSRMPDVVDVLLSSNRVNELLCIVNGSLESFMETYNLTLPDVSTNEMQFILSLVGVVSNMAATPDGRQFLLTDPNGRELISLMMTILPKIPLDSGDCLKRVMLMSLYNLSIDQLGLLMLLDKTCLFEEVAKNIVSENNPELRLLSLRLLQSLTMEIPSSQAYQEIASSIPMDKLQDLTNTTDADMRLLARNIVGSMEQADVKFGDVQQVSRTSMAWDHCRQQLGTTSSVCSANPRNF